MQTPWGESDGVTRVAPGIVFVTTPSHGGYKLDAERNAKVKPAWRAATFNGQGERGWYEEDCDWCLVALTFPDVFPDRTREPARKMFDHLFAEKIAKAEGRAS